MQWSYIVYMCVYAHALYPSANFFSANSQKIWKKDRIRQKQLHWSSMILALLDFDKESTYLNLFPVFSSIPSSSHSIFKAIIIMGGYYCLQCKNLCCGRDKGEKATLCSYFLPSLQKLPNLFCPQFSNLLCLTFHRVKTIHQTVISTYSITKSTHLL